MKLRMLYANWIVLGALCFLTAPSSSFSKDYLLEVLDEFYNETYLYGGNNYEVYHTLQVRTPFGNKLIVISGDNYTRRTWLRGYLEDNNIIVLKIPLDNDPEFAGSIAYSVDLDQVHPLKDKYWGGDKPKKSESDEQNGSPAPSPTAMETQPEALEEIKHILLVDDEASEIQSSKQILEHLGYRLTTRESAKEALNAFNAAPNDFDLLLTDQLMPEMKGTELAKEIKKTRPDIPIVLLTGLKDVIHDDMVIKELGIEHFIRKPLVAGDLAKVVRSVLYYP